MWCWVLVIVLFSVEFVFCSCESFVKGLFGVLEGVRVVRVDWSVLIVWVIFGVVGVLCVVIRLLWEFVMILVSVDLVCSVLILKFLIVFSSVDVCCVVLVVVLRVMFVFLFCFVV